MEILNQLEKRDFQVMKFLLKSVSNDASKRPEAKYLKTDLKKYIYEIFTQKEKKSPLTSSSNSSKSRSY
jgi:hypothetical protein